MAIKSPKNKGSGGEREAASLLTVWAAEVGVELKLERNLEQVRYGGADINGVPGMEVEVKRVEKLNVEAAWRQVCRAARKSGKHPLLMHRKNRQKWKFRTWFWAAIYAGDKATTVAIVGDLELPSAKSWFQERIKLEYSVRQKGEDE